MPRLHTSRAHVPHATQHLRSTHRAKAPSTTGTLVRPKLHSTLSAFSSRRQAASSAEQQHGATHGAPFAVTLYHHHHSSASSFLVSPGKSGRLKRKETVRGAVPRPSCQRTLRRTSHHTMLRSAGNDPEVQTRRSPTTGSWQQGDGCKGGWA